MPGYSFPRHIPVLLVLLVLSLSAAWSAGRTRVVPVEPAPLEAMLEEAGESNLVVWDLPVTRNESVDQWIEFLAGRNYQRTRLWLERTGMYGPMIRSELRARGMPEDLLYLALIESGLSPRAYSKAAASGMWQFIAETGRRYGLEITGEVDERRDPVKSTTAALAYLQELHDRFGSWYLAAAAYNTGENRIGRIMRETFGTERGTDDKFWEIAHRLPRETRDYVPLMLAAGHIGKEPERYGFHGLQYQDPLAFEQVWVPGAVDLSMVAQAAGVDESDIREMNLHLMRGRTPANRGWSVRMPAGSRVAFEAAFPELYRTARLARAEPAHAGVIAAGGAARAAPATDRTDAVAHRVRQGETLSHIARRYGVSVAALRSANANVDPRRLRPGQTLRVPGASASARTAQAPSPRIHQVRRGENLTVIARRYGVTIRQIQAWNGLRGTRIQAGQRLRINA
ncbi:MAG TPA: LysM peptidoglycan-binding domain-containing protein [Longimicrobiales bacterium]|nr:LysM peptidoglycan-binding domain-containing protein [Longimicrobiales bacterium]